MGHLPRRPPLRSPFQRCLARGRCGGRCGGSRRAGRGACHSARAAATRRSALARPVRRPCRTPGGDDGLRRLAAAEHLFSLRFPVAAGRPAAGDADRHPGARRTGARPAGGLAGAAGAGNRASARRSRPGLGAGASGARTCTGAARRAACRAGAHRAVLPALARHEPHAAGRSAGRPAQPRRSGHHGAGAAGTTQLARLHRRRDAAARTGGRRAGALPRWRGPLCGPGARTHDHHAEPGRGACHRPARDGTPARRVHPRADRRCASKAASRSSWPI